MATVDAIAHILTSTLNPDSSVRIAAELNLSELLKNPRKLTFLVARDNLAYVHTRHATFWDKMKESAPSLAQLVLSQEAESSLRQMSPLASGVRKGRILDDVVLFWDSTRRSSYSEST